MSSTSKEISRGAHILAFPLARRRDLVKKPAEQMLAHSPTEAEGHLSFELERHRRVLRRRQLSEDVIDGAISRIGTCSPGRVLASRHGAAWQSA
jgi:hypothetical protein